MKLQLISHIERTSSADRSIFTNLLNSISMTLRKPAFAALAIVLVLGTMTGGTVYASQDALPGQPLYGVKIASEKVSVALKGDKAEKADLHLKYAQRRVDELQALINSGDVTPELVRETQTLLSDLMDDVEVMAHEIGDHETVVEIAMRANESTDDYVDAFKQIPSEQRDHYDDVAQHVVSSNLEHDDEFMAILMDRYEANPTAALKTQIQEQMREELAKELQYLSMLEGGLNFATTVDRESAAVAEAARQDLAAAQAFADRVEALIADPNFDPIALHDLIEDADQGHDIHEAFASLEDHFSDEQYEDLEYDGPWIDEGKDDFDAHAQEGDCHPLDDETLIECFDGRQWITMTAEEFFEESARRDDYRFEGRDDYYDDDARHDEFPPMPEDMGGSYEFELIAAEFDKDGDNVPDCIGQEGCPGQEFWEQIFNRPCDAECERMLDEEDRRDYEDYEDEEYYDDGNPDHFPPPADAGRYPDDHDENYDPANDPYSGDEFDYPHEENGRWVE